MKETLKNVDELYDKINQLLKSYDLLKKNNDKILEDLGNILLFLKIVVGHWQYFLINDIDPNYNLYQKLCEEDRVHLILPA